MRNCRGRKLRINITYQSGNALTAGFGSCPGTANVFDPLFQGSGYEVKRADRRKSQWR
jgi:hypothetical protein